MPENCKPVLPIPPMVSVSTRLICRPGKEGYVDRYPTPDELWAMTFDLCGLGKATGVTVLLKFRLKTRAASGKPRFYQHNAINKTLEAIAEGKDRILLTLATGTGKTFIAFQLAWKLFHSRWNLKTGERPKVAVHVSCFWRIETFWRSGLQQFFCLPGRCADQNLTR